MIITIGSSLKDDKGNAYILDDIIGAGGFGYVFKAHCESDNTIVAIKLLQNAFSSDEAYLTFKKEANQARLIFSDNVIKYYYIHDGKEYPELPPYIIMEYTGDGTLRDVIQRQNGIQFDKDTLVRLFIQLANGMKCISNQLVHRDIKPENILNFDGTLKISDFGLSKISGDSTKTMSFKNMGTPLYIAPEAWHNDNNTIQMDIYSMGIVFFELATLSYPYTIPTSGNYNDYRDMHLYQTVNNPSKINKDIPPYIVSMIIKMLEKTVKKRYKNWDEILAVLHSKEQPDDDISTFVGKALSTRNDKDLQLQHKQAETKRKEEEKKSYIKHAYMQFFNTIIEPIKEFADRFNAQYSGDNIIKIRDGEPSEANVFVTEIVLPSDKIIITGEILFRERFVKSVLDPFGQERQVNYIPQCNRKDIILWCQMKNREHQGLNILLLKNQEDIYGDWVILTNQVNRFAMEDRPSPFGFSISELPEEIERINTMYIYDSEIIPFSMDKIYEFIISSI